MLTPTQSPQPGEVDDLADDVVLLLPGLDLNEGRVDLKVELVVRLPGGNQDQDSLRLGLVRAQKVRRMEMLLGKDDLVL